MALILLPDASALVPDHTRAWLAYLTLSQVRDVGLCLLAIWAPKNYATRVVLLIAASWYAGQAIDEWRNGNLFKDGYWEYGLLAALCVAAIILIRHERERPKGQSNQVDH